MDARREKANADILPDDIQVFQSGGIGEGRKGTTS
jgi:hypothetical protein